MLVEISAEALVTSRVDPTIEFDGFPEFLNRRIKVVPDLPVGLGEPGIEAYRQIALGHFAKPLGQSLDSTCLFFGSGGLRLGVTPALILGLNSMLFGLFALPGRLDFEASFVLTGVAEDQDGLGHLADLILALGALDLDVERALRQGIHALTQTRYRRADPRHRQP